MAACLDGVRPTPRALGLDVPPAVEAVFQRALALEPRDRHVNAADFWRNLCAAADWSVEDRNGRLDLAALAALEGESGLPAELPRAESSTAIPLPTIETETTLSRSLPYSVPARPRGRRGTIAKVAVLAGVVLGIGALTMIAAPARQPRSSSAVPRPSAAAPPTRDAFPASKPEYAQPSVSAHATAASARSSTRPGEPASALRTMPETREAPSGTAPSQRAPATRRPEADSRPRRAPATTPSSSEPVDAWDRRL